MNARDIAWRTGHALRFALMSEPQPGEWPTYSAYRQDDGSDEVISDPPRRRPVTVLAWILLFHLTIIGWTLGYLVGTPQIPLWVVLIGMAASVAIAVCSYSLWTPPTPRAGESELARSARPLAPAAAFILAVLTPAMLSIGISNLYVLTMMRPTEATVLSAERVPSGRHSSVWQATVDLGDGRPQQVRAGSTLRKLDERIPVWVDPTGFAAPRGSATRPFDVAGPLMLGLPGAGLGYYGVIRHLRRTRTRHYDSP
ncbi:hypothetical protein C8D81_1511 [Enemella evansiae]|nr:hypothetical protein C8D81_1511 [Enemella evansiae]